MESQQEGMEDTSCQVRAPMQTDNARRVGAKESRLDEYVTFGKARLENDPKALGRLESIVDLKVWWRSEEGGFV